MTDLMERLRLPENTFSWDFEVENTTGILRIRLKQGTFPPIVRVPKMVCVIQFSEPDTEEGQIVFLAENSLFQREHMTTILDFFNEHLVEV